MTTMLMEQLKTGDVIEIKTPDDDVITVLVLLATDDAARARPLQRPDPVRASTPKNSSSTASSTPSRCSPTPERQPGPVRVPQIFRSDPPSRFRENPPSVGAVDNTAPTLFFRVGGMPFFERLVDAFYEGVRTDEVLLPLYPEQPDLTGARHRLTLFLAQYWGGPTTYMEERGHPRLRMRHFPFHVGRART